MARSQLTEIYNSLQNAKVKDLYISVCRYRGITLWPCHTKQTQVTWHSTRRRNTHQQLGSSWCQHRDRAPPFQGRETLPLWCLQLGRASRCARERGLAAQAACWTAARKLEKVHSDVCGPMQTLSNSGKRYMVTFVDDFTRSCVVYFMAHKSDTLEKFKEFHAKVTGESGERIGILKTDGGGEYKSREFAQYLIRHQIEHEVTVPDSREMNGLAERMNRTILEKAKCMCVHAGLPY